MAINFGMPAGFGELLNRKYGLLQQDADTSRITADANANLTRVQAGLMPAESASEIAERAANAYNLWETGRTQRPLAASTIRQAGMVGQNQLAQADQSYAQGAVLRRSLGGLSQSQYDPYGPRTWLTGRYTGGFP